MQPHQIHETRAGVGMVAIFIDDGDWEEVAAGQLERGICEACPLNDVVKVRGEPVLGGFFGIPKKMTKMKKLMVFLS